VILHDSAIKFVALSYVWGASQTTKLDTQNEESLAVEGAFNTHILPRTIYEAVLLTKQLEIDYLWVDALCILQDSDADKAAQISMMDTIYNAAYVTIIAASGKDSDGSLPGLKPGSRCLEQEEIVIQNPASRQPGFSLLTTLAPLDAPTHHYLEKTVWNSRGRTMQEQVLSRRAIIFTDEQVCWVCNGAIFCEESHLEISETRFSRFHTPAWEMTLQRTFRNISESQDPRERFWAQYQDFVARFTKRNFSYDGDVHDGFSAILRALAEMSSESFIWGLPRSRLELGLSWTTFTGQHRRETLSTLPMTQMNVRVPFPSWSWMGWIGEAWVSVANSRVECGEDSEIVCYIHRHDPLDIVPVNVAHSVTNEDSGTDKEWKLHTYQAVNIADVNENLPDIMEDTIIRVPPEQYLFFWTSSAVFELQRRDNESRPTVVDLTGTLVGNMGPMSEDHWTRGKYDSGFQEFIVIGSRRSFDIKPELIVLQIEWRDGVAFRVNIGEINEDAWIKADRTWKLIALG
jgi:hypothetical protein